MKNNKTMKNNNTKYKRSINKFFKLLVTITHTLKKKKTPQTPKGILSDKNTERLTNLSCHHLIKHYNIYDRELWKF